MAARIIHFGPDDCHRLTVLRSAGYSVDACGSLGQLRASLVADREADAVVMTEGDGVAPEEAITLARSHSSAPVVLFSGSNRSYEESSFDLVVHSLTPPDEWLVEVDVLIAKNRELRAQSEAIGLESARLRYEAAQVRERSQAERERSRKECARNAGPDREDPPFHYSRYG